MRGQRQRGAVYLADLRGFALSDTLVFYARYFRLFGLDSTLTVSVKIGEFSFCVGKSF